MSSSVTVSICCITYNHENYIGQAIEGFLMQKADFPMEIIIHDDASTDRTAAIIREYAAKHPGLIVPLFQRENQHSQGKKVFVNYVMPMCRGKYIANCEGDDYWTDPYKLQKQVDFLEAHPEYSMCFHNVTIFHEDGDREANVRYATPQKEIWPIEDIVFRNPISTCSVLYRHGLIKEWPEWYYTLPMGDWPLWVLLATKGKVGYLHEDMATYRVHPGGMFTGRNVVSWASKLLDAYDVMDRSLGFAYHQHIQRGKAHYLDDIAADYLVQSTESMSVQEGVGAFLALWQQHTDCPPPAKGRLVGRLYARRFFRAARTGNYATIKQSFVGLVLYNRSCLRNRGVWSILVKSLLGK